MSDTKCKQYISNEKNRFLKIIVEQNQLYITNKDYKG